VRIKNLQQPLAISVDKRTGLDICLIPELCFMTGMNESMRANFNLMKQINEVVHRGARDRVREIQQTVNDLLSQDQVKRITD
jgi:hypothetical protein